MCRRNQLLGCCAACFGLGLLVGSGLESGLFCVCASIGLIFLGLRCIQQK